MYPGGVRCRVRIVKNYRSFLPPTPSYVAPGAAKLATGTALLAYTLWSATESTPSSSSSTRPKDLNSEQRTAHVGKCNREDVCKSALSIGIGCGSGGSGPNLLRSRSSILCEEISKERNQKIRAQQDDVGHVGAGLCISSRQEETMGAETTEHTHQGSAAATSNRGEDFSGKASRPTFAERRPRSLRASLRHGADVLRRSNPRVVHCSTAGGATTAAFGASGGPRGARSAADSGDMDPTTPLVFITQNDKKKNKILSMYKKLLHSTSELANAILRLTRKLFRMTTRCATIFFNFAPLLVFSAPAAFCWHQSSSYRTTWYSLLLTCVEQCGPAFVKFAQWAATRPDLFPDQLYQM